MKNVLTDSIYVSQSLMMGVAINPINMQDSNQGDVKPTSINIQSRTPQFALQEQDKGSPCKFWTVHWTSWTRKHLFVMIIPVTDDQYSFPPLAAPQDKYITYIISVLYGPVEDYIVEESGSVQVRWKAITFTPAYRTLSNEELRVLCLQGQTVRDPSVRKIMVLYTPKQDDQDDVNLLIV